MVSPPDRGEPIYRRKTFVIARRSGRLGNRLVIFANFIALVRERGDRLINFTFHSYAHLFEQPSKDLYCQYPIPDRPGLLERVPGLAAAIRKSRLFYHVTRYASDFHERLPIAGPRVITLRETRGQEITPLEGEIVRARIRDARIVFVNGWNFRAPEAVEKHAEVVRQYLRPIREHEDAARRCVAELRREADTVVGVHVRQGDYRQWRGGKFCFSAERYRAWMQELAQQFPGRKVAFLVCSDEPRNAGEFEGLRVGFGPDTPVGDMTAISMCDYIIGPMSTFTQWASFYGGKPMQHLGSAEEHLNLARFRISYLGEIPGWDPADEAAALAQVQ
jgi:hypothetical protein